MKVENMSTDEILTQAMNMIVNNIHRQYADSAPLLSITDAKDGEFHKTYKAVMYYLIQDETQVKIYQLENAIVCRMVTILSIANQDVCFQADENGTDIGSKFMLEAWFQIQYLINEHKQEHKQSDCARPHFFSNKYLNNFEDKLVYCANIISDYDSLLQETNSNLIDTLLYQENTYIDARTSQNFTLPPVFSTSTFAAWLTKF